MRQKPGTRKSHGEKVVKDIRRATRKRYSAEEKIRIEQLRKSSLSVSPSRVLSSLFVPDPGDVLDQFIGGFERPRRGHQHLRQNHPLQ